MSAARLLLVSMLVLGCDEAAPEAEGVTWHHDIAPLLARHCLGCHREGGIGQLRLDTFAAARDAAKLVLGAVESGVMPPWMPSADCHPLADARRLDDADKALLRTWVELGQPEGRAGSGPAVAPAPDFVASETLLATVGTNADGSTSDSYLPEAGVSDDYHCFVLDRAFAEDTYIVGSQLVPGSGQVHHALVYAIEPSQLHEVATRDAAAPGPGYPCFAQPISTGFADQDAFIRYLAGGELPNFDFPIQLGAWVPGTLPRTLPAGSAYRVPAGSKLVVQIHYSLVGAPVTDKTKLLLAFGDRPPTELLRTRPVAVLDLAIPAGAGPVRQHAAFPYIAAEPLAIVGVMGHMHLLGSAFEASLLRPPFDADGGECLLDIPRWDFHWQESYRFEADDPVIVQPGDRVAVTCTYDNRAGHQPVDASGVRSAPRDVAWGEGTADEMCIFYYTSTHPFTPTAPPPATLCAPAADCIAGCDPTSLACLLECTAASTSCQLCGVRAALQCSEMACLGTLTAATDCMVSCLEASLMLGTNLGQCLRSECPAAYDAALACLDAPLGEASCRERFEACGVDFPER